MKRADADIQRSETGQRLASLTEVEKESKAEFPVFMKLIVVFLVFAVFPFLITSLTIAWNYDASFRSLLEGVNVSIGERERLMAQLHNLTHDLRIRIGFLFLIFGAFIILGTRIAGKVLVNPLSLLLKAMERLSKGEFGARVTWKATDEFAIFADYFNRMSQQLELSQRREQWLSQQKTQLITLAAHQLRTPLTVVQWVLNNLTRKDVENFTKEQRELLEKGLISAKRMTHLIDSLLNATAIEEGRFGYRFLVADLTPLLQKVAEEARMLAETKKIAITLHIPPALPLAYLDPEKIQFVLENIFTNAVRYTPPKGTITVAVGLRESDEGARGEKSVFVSIQDSGIGIAKKDIMKLFTRFFRTQEASAAYTEGAGLGLFIARNIIQRHGGKIWAESEPGKGSTFTFTLPAARETTANQPSEQFFLGA